ncbi:hypothetical protein KC878_02780, partial [Candidatus Saccharibacteria bacterium]|nr:hypothetical protein [Candidatus Saccharibacteria bacterium]
MVDISSFAEVAQNLEGQIAGYSLKSVGLASLLIIMLVITGMQIKQHKPKYSLHVFLLITAIVGST